MDENLQHILQSDDWYKDLFDNAHDLIHVAYPDGRLLYINNSWSRLLEYREEEIRGKSFYSFIHQNDRQRFMQYRENLLSGIPVDDKIIFSLVTKSGRVVSIEGFVSVKTSHGQPVYTRGIFRDVTTRIQNEEKLRQYNKELIEREQNLQQLLVNAPDAIIVIDKEGIITFWNPKAEVLFGWTAGEVVGTSLSDTIIPQQHKSAHNEGMKRYLATGEAHVMNKTIEITALNKSGKEFYVSLTISTTRQNNEMAFIAFLRDISEQKKIQVDVELKTEELKTLNANLEEFVYAASHDLKEPIRKVHVFSDLLKQKLEAALNEETRRLFERMEVATERMQLLVDDLLEYSHLTRSTEKWEDVDLNKKIQLVLGDLELLVQEKNAVIQIARLPTIHGHRRQIQQLFQNLIGNALKYNKPGQRPEIRIAYQKIKGVDIPLAHVKKSDKEKLFHSVSVSDNGIGFNQEDTDRIFLVFQRLQGNAEYSGTGVGLSIVKKVVENHNGYIKAEGIKDKGAIFTVYLPAN